MIKNTRDVKYGWSNKCESIAKKRESIAKGPYQPGKWSNIFLATLTLCASTAVFAETDYVLVTGRRDPRIFAIEMKAALRSENNGTDKSIVSRSLVNPPRLDGKLLGDPANIKLSADQRTAFVMNHHGAVVNAEFLQHGGRGSISVMNVGKMVSRRHDNTTEALISVYDLGWFGGVGLIILPDLIIGSAGEGWLAETGSNRISFIDRKTGGLRGQIQMALTGPGTRQLSQGCAPFPVPFVSPTEAPVNPILAPDPHDGCWPDPEGIALGAGSDGKPYLFSGNADTEDISVMDLEKALAGDPVVEVAPRIPIQSGPFTISASPNGKYIAATARESHIADFEGNTLSIIDVDLARQGKPGAEVARVLVGTDDPSVQGRPFTATWTPDGQRIVVTNYRLNSLSVVDLKRALAHDPKAEIARIPLTRPDMRDAQPKGVAVTGDGQYALVAGGPNSIKTSATTLTGMLHVVDIQHFYQVSTVANVGIDPYGVVIVDRDRKSKREDE
jgi:DNA-binding beta-propeller fold protein YncE